MADVPRFGWHRVFHPLFGADPTTLLVTEVCQPLVTRFGYNLADLERCAACQK
jgi:hypothetical protein